MTQRMAETKVYECPYCEQELPDEHAPCCGESGHGRPLRCQCGRGDVVAVINGSGGFRCCTATIAKYDVLYGSSK